MSLRTGVAAAGTHRAGRSLPEPGPGLGQPGSKLHPGCQEPVPATVTGERPHPRHTVPVLLLAPPPAADSA